MVNSSCRRNMCVRHTPYYERTMVEKKPVGTGWILTTAWIAPAGRELCDGRAASVTSTAPLPGSAMLMSPRPYLAWHGPCGTVTGCPPLTQGDPRHALIRPRHSGPYPSGFRPYAYRAGQQAPAGPEPGELAASESLPARAISEIPARARDRRDPGFAVTAGAVRTRHGAIYDWQHQRPRTRMCRPCPSSAMPTCCR